MACLLDRVFCFRLLGYYPEQERFELSEESSIEMLLTLLFCLEIFL